MTKKRKIINLLECIGYGALTGVITGCVVWGFIFVVENLLEASEAVYAFVHNHLAFLPLLIGGLVIAAFIGHINSKYVAEARGGGVPYIEGVSRKKLPICWYKALPAEILGSCVTFVSGLPLGSEGPSVLLGGAIGSGVSKIGSKKGEWESVIATGGACAGFATAVGAPFAGIIFALEECRKDFSPSLIVTSSVSVIFATVASKLLGLWTGYGHALFEFETAELNVGEMYLPLIIGVAAGAVAVAFALMLKYSSSLMNKIKIPRFAKIASAFVLSGIVCLFFADFIGGGASLIRKIGAMEVEWQILLAMLILKLVFVTLCSSAEVTGGMFIPLMCIGALVGGLVGNIAMACGMSATYYSTLVLISMCAFLGAALKAPIMSVILVVEMGGSANTFFAAMIAVAVAYFVSYLCGGKSIYDESLDKIIDNRKEKGESEPPVEDEELL